MTFRNNQNKELFLKDLMSVMNKCQTRPPQYNFFNLSATLIKWKKKAKGTYEKGTSLLGRKEYLG